MKENDYLSITNNSDKSIEERTKDIIDDALKDIAAFYKRKRKEKGFTQRDLNKITHVGIGVIAELETAVSMPRLETLVRLAIGLDFNDMDITILLKKYIPDKSKLEKYNGYRMLVSDLFREYHYSESEIEEISKFLKYIEYKRKLDQ